ncbi:MAG: hypothetical protein KDC98_19815 [Planctomycetes bacterium]|nr:hypothetical protein [Planctomycetota bacterium]
MNLKKSNIALLIAAAALAVPTTIQLASEAESFVDYSRIPLMFDGFTDDNVGFVAIGKPKAEQPKPNPQTPEQKPPVAYDQLTLQRSDKGWMIGPTPGEMSNLVGVPVNAPLVESNVFEHLRKIRADKQTLIQENATSEQLAEYGLDEAHATFMKVSDKTGQNIVAALYIGSEATTPAEPGT